MYTYTSPRPSSVVNTDDMNTIHAYNNVIQKSEFRDFARAEFSTEFTTANFKVEKSA